MVLMPGSCPPPCGLYDPAFERDACGIGFVARVDGRKSNDILKKALKVLINLDHRGARGPSPILVTEPGCFYKFPILF